MHLIPSEEEDALTTASGASVHLSVNANVFRNLDSPVSEGGDNFSAGEKQLIWWVSCNLSSDVEI